MPLGEPGLALSFAVPPQRSLAQKPAGHLGFPPTFGFMVSGKE